MSIETLIAPLARASFLAEYREKAPLLVARDQPSFYGDLLSLDDVDALLGSADLPAGTVRLLRDGAETPAPGVTRDSAFRHFGSGGTIAINTLERNLPRLSELCAALGADLGYRAQANIYLTPPGGQGFAAHYDDHDVFVLQVRGAKSWRVFADPPRELPLKGQFHRPTTAAPTPKRGAPLIDAEVKQGDLLYIPRGFVHEARSGNATSMHITLGLHGLPWVDLFSAALRRLADEDVTFRRSLPPGLGNGAAGPREEALRTARLLVSALSNLPIEAALDEHIREWSCGVQPTVGPRLADIEASRDLRPESVVRRRPGVRLAIDPRNDVTHVRFNQKKVELPATADTLARFIAATPEFALREAPRDLGEAGVKAVVTNLIREGALEVREPREERDC